MLHVVTFHPFELSRTHVAEILLSLLKLCLPVFLVLWMKAA